MILEPLRRSKRVKNVIFPNRLVDLVDIELLEL